MSAQIRLASETDAEQMLEIYAPVVRETVISFEYEPPSLPEFRDRVRATLEWMPWLVCDNDGDVAGYAYASPFRTRAGYQWACELTIYVHPGYHRCGIGRALYTALFGCLALQGYCVAVATITIPNAASIALHESMGMRRVGAYEKVGYKHGRWLDDGVWQIDLQSAPADPEPPVPWHQVSGLPQWREALAAGQARLKL